MVDFDEGRMLGELQELEEEIELLKRFKFTITGQSAITVSRTIDRLNRKKGYVEMRLRIHRQKVAESGVKY